jgi:hypothetical protein
MSDYTKGILHGVAGATVALILALIFTSIIL